MIANELMYGKNKYRKLYYIVGGTVIAVGILDAVLSYSGGGEGNTGTISIIIPDPSERGTTL